MLYIGRGVKEGLMPPPQHYTPPPPSPPPPPRTKKKPRAFPRVSGERTYLEEADDAVVIHGDENPRQHPAISRDFPQGKLGPRSLVAPAALAPKTTGATGQPPIRGTIVNRTYGSHKNLHISLFLLPIFGPIYYAPPVIVCQNRTAPPSFEETR